MPKGKSEAVNPRTDNTTVKRRRTKRKTTIYKTQHRKVKNRATRTPLNTGVNSNAPKW